MTSAASGGLWLQHCVHLPIGWVSDPTLYPHFSEMLNFQDIKFRVYVEKNSTQQNRHQNQSNGKNTKQVLHSHLKLPMKPHYSHYCNNRCLP